MSKKIKIGLVGLGHLGKIHLELIRQIDHFVLSGIYDIDVKRAKSFFSISIFSTTLFSFAFNFSLI